MVLAFVVGVSAKPLVRQNENERLTIKSTALERGLSMKIPRYWH
jgi:hypothetical protein